MNREHQEIVVGSSLKAILFAFKKNCPVIFTDPQTPFRFEYLDYNINLDALKLDNKKNKLLSTDNHKFVGLEKFLLWERLLFLLSLDSKVPLSNLCKSIRCDDNKIVCFNEYSKIAQFKFDKCYYFDEENSVGFIKEKNIDSELITCYDWIAFNKGGKHKVDYIETDNSFVKNVWFYPSDRIDGATAIKDACIVSQLRKNQLESFDFSETMARFKLEHEMYARGMKGPSNGYGPNGKLKYYKFRTTSITRTTCRTKRQIRPKASNIEVPQISEQDLLEDLQQSSVGYNRFLKWL